MDPLARLGLSADAGPDDIRRAYRALALRAHPDRGGDRHEMAELSEAYRLALAATRSRPARSARRPARVQRDVASFTIDALPVVAHEALLLVASAIGDLADDDPPYVLEFVIREGDGLWCRCDIVPDAGSCTVSVTVASVGDDAVVDCETVRDLLVAELNALDWPSS